MTYRFRGAPSGRLFQIREPPFEYSDFVPQAEGTVPWREGRVWYNVSQHTFSIYNDIENTALDAGQEFWIRVYNHDYAVIPNGSAVYMSGAQGNRPKAGLAIATAEETSRVVGLATHDIPQHTEGWVTTLGAVHDINTLGFSADGVPFYLSDTTPGGIVETPPVGPSITVRIGIVLNTTTHGILFVAPYKQF